MKYNRREFVKLSAILGAGTALLPLTNVVSGCNAATKVNINKIFGLQLYTLRDVLPKDPKGVLQQVASFGYKQIESYEGPMGMFWGMKNTEFKKLMDDLGMEVIASHCDIHKDFERKAAEAKEIGMKYLICPWLGAQKTLDDYKKFADVFNQRGEVCRKHGIKFAYHNHDYSFVPLEGKFPQDVLMQNSDKSLVDYEMDIYWVVTAGQNPIEWLKKYPQRFKLSHVKDRKKNVPQTEKDVTVNLGTGQIDFKKILKEAAQQGMEYFIVEQEAYEHTTPIDAVRANAAYMKNLTL